MNRIRNLGEKNRPILIFMTYITYIVLKVCMASGVRLGRRY